MKFSYALNQTIFCTYRNLLINLLGQNNMHGTALHYITQFVINSAGNVFLNLKIAWLLV